MTAMETLSPRPAAHRTELDGAFAARLAGALINHIECGLVACEGDGTLLYANRAAQRELAAARVLTASQGTLRCVGSAAAEFQSALVDAASRRRTRLLRLGEPGDRLMVAVMPVAADQIGDQTALVMIGRRAPCSPLGLEMLARRHGLTLTETRVLHALLGNSTPRDIAAAHGVGMATIRTQIQSIRGKMGARSIDALLLQASEVPPVTSWH